MLGITYLILQTAFLTLVPSKIFFERRKRWNRWGKSEVFGPAICPVSPVCRKLILPFPLKSLVFAVRNKLRSITILQTTWKVSFERIDKIKRREREHSFSQFCKIRVNSV